MKNPFKPKRIGEKYLQRWHLIPRNKFFNIYLHRFVGNDDDRALHDHPWRSFSIRLFGQLREFHNDVSLLKPSGFSQFTEQPSHRGAYCLIAPRFRLRSATFAHRLELVDPNKPAWTLFFTGPVLREWGFHCPKGWQHWSTMTNRKGEKIGGCD